MAETKREYAVRLGLAKANSRGRLSLKAHEAIKAAINKGTQFSDGSEKLGTGVENTAPVRHDRPEGYYTFQNPDGSTFKRLHTEACAKCNYSFQWCICIEGTTQFVYPPRPGMWEERAVLLEIPKVVRTGDVPEKKPQRGRGRGTTRRATGGGNTRGRARMRS